MSYETKDFMNNDEKLVNAIIDADIATHTRRMSVLESKPSRDDYQTWEAFYEAYKKWSDQWDKVKIYG